ncbi:MAG TPA: NAD(P)(+) transhydrogenase (Re/Si-specific) subunit beta, partial [Candidatus Bathyarchaeia archaeon]|nr:NAD(P)(+) transhydrogenase (Re/Si-specific) subunit beta [Candidatus Bathyarchaeia archaeon]
MPASLVSVGYIAAGILFILSLGGLSNPETARRGNLLGVLGMALALAAATFSGRVSGYGPLVAAVVPAVVIGATLASRVEMTAMPQLVAILHSFVGAAAVLVGFGSYLNGVDLSGAERVVHELEIFVGVAVGAVTFTGSV